MWPTFRWLSWWARMPEVDLDDRTPRIEHGANRCCHPGPVHPMEGLAKADDPERAEGRGKLLRPYPDPLGVVDPLIGRAAHRFRHHPGIRVEADDAVEQVCEQECDDPGTAADVEEPPLAVQAEMCGQGFGQF